MTITLKPWEYQHAAAVGIARFTANWGRPNAAHYDPAKMEPDRSAQVAAAACELAVARATNRYWHAGVWHASEHHLYKHLPDVGSNIEVRRCRTSEAVAVRRSDAGKIVFAARTIDEEYRRIEVVGWIAADDVIPTLAPGQNWLYIDFGRLTPVSGDKK